MTQKSSKVRYCRDPRCARQFTPSRNDQNYCRPGCRTNHFKRLKRCRLQPLWEGGAATLYAGDALTVLSLLPASSVQAIITSPPYWRQRDYKVEGQLGQERHPEEYLAALTQIFTVARRVLRSDGVMFVNLADTYDRHKQLLGLPDKLASTLKAAGWIYRQAIIWEKPNVIPQSCRDRFANSYEHVLLFSRSSRYHFNLLKEPAKYAGYKHARREDRPARALNANRWRSQSEVAAERVMRDVWRIPPASDRSDHLARMAGELAARCCRAGARPGDLVLDPLVVFQK